MWKHVFAALKFHREELGTIHRSYRNILLVEFPFLFLWAIVSFGYYNPSKTGLPYVSLSMALHIKDVQNNIEISN